MIAVVKDIFKWRELLVILIVRNLKIRYKNSALGFFWSLLGPLCLILIYAIFASILRFSGGNPHYLQFLIIGILVWQFLSMCLNDSLGAIIGNSNLVKKTSFPRMILPLSMVLANALNFLLTLAVLVIYLLFCDTRMSNLALLPLALLTQFALCMGLSLMISAVNVFFRDVEHMLGVVLLGWFFLSPVFYPVQAQLERLPAAIQWMVFLNPMTGILSVYRAIFMSDAIVAGTAVMVSFAMSWVILFLGALFFEKVQPVFADNL